MRRRVLFALSLALPGVAVPALEGLAHAGCGFDLIVKNERTEEVIVEKISTSTTMTIYKKQWDGVQRLAPGESHKFSFTVDNCPSSQRRWTRVLFRIGSQTFADKESHVSGDTQILEAPDAAQP